MPLPAMLAGLASFAQSPAVLSTIGTIMPSVLSALTGSPTEAEAKAAVGPKRQEMIDALIKGGLDRSTAEQHADDALQGEVSNAMASGGMPPWFEGALTVAAGAGGWKLGKWLKGAKGSVPQTGTIPGAPATGTVKEGAAQAGGKVTPAGPTAPTAAVATPPPSASQQAALSGPFPSAQAPIRKLAPTPDQQRRFGERAPAQEPRPLRGPFAWADDVMAKEDMLRNEAEDLMRYSGNR